MAVDATTASKSPPSLHLSSAPPMGASGVGAPSQAAIRSDTMTPPATFRTLTLIADAGVADESSPATTTTPTFQVIVSEDDPCHVLGVKWNGIPITEANEACFKVVVPQQTVAAAAPPLPPRTTTVAAAPPDDDDDDDEEEAVIPTAGATGTAGVPTQHGTKRAAKESTRSEQPPTKQSKHHGVGPMPAAAAETTAAAGAGDRSPHGTDDLLSEDADKDDDRKMEAKPSADRGHSSPSAASSSSSHATPNSAGMIASANATDGIMQDPLRLDDLVAAPLPPFGPEEATTQPAPLVPCSTNASSPSPVPHPEVACASGTAANDAAGFWYSSLLPGIDVEQMFQMLCDGAKIIERDPETLDEEYADLPFTASLKTARDVFRFAGYLCSRDDAHREVQAPANVGSDFHGQITALIAAHTHNNEDRKIRFIVLGNFVGKGYNSWWLSWYLALFKIMHPDLIFLIRGNHETKTCVFPVNETSLLEESKKRFGLKKGHLWFEALHEFFRSFQYAITLTASDDVQGVKPLILTHGGFPQNPQYRGLRTWNEVPICDREKDFGDAMLSDPCKGHEGDSFTAPLRGPQSTRFVQSARCPRSKRSVQSARDDSFIQSERGSRSNRSVQFDRDALGSFLDANSAQALIRGHGRPEGGYEELWGRKVVTIESSISHGNHGCFLRVDRRLDWSVKKIME